MIFFISSFRWGCVWQGDVQGTDCKSCRKPPGHKRQWFRMGMKQVRKRRQTDCWKTGVLSAQLVSSVPLAIYFFGKGHIRRNHILQGAPGWQRRVSVVLIMSRLYWQGGDHIHQRNLGVAISPAELLRFVFRCPVIAAYIGVSPWQIGAVEWWRGTGIFLLLAWIWFNGLQAA